MDDQPTPTNPSSPDTGSGRDAETQPACSSDDLLPASTSRDQPDASAPSPDVYEAELVEAKPTRQPLHPARFRQLKRRRMLPLMLFLLTCVSTFYVGMTLWIPSAPFLAAPNSLDLMPFRRMLLAHWSDGLVYMGCLLAILLTHEMGHFLATVRYRIPASYPYFIPLPISPIGTMGAVIGMDGLRANRREMFDIGIAGPLAGLVVAIPIMWIGVERLDFSQPAAGPYGFDYELDVPLGVRFLLDSVPPQGYSPGQKIAYGHINAFFMAGWVGLLVTGLNMMPVSQLDGGHVIYTLFRKRAHWVARIFMVTAIVLMVLGVVTRHLWLMVGLILLIGTDHPPTRDDNVELGWARTLLGFASLSIPFLCFAPKLIILNY